MNKELKRQIANFILDNGENFQLTNATAGKFRPYIYGEDGNFLIGGKEVYLFITEFVKISKL